MSFRQYRKFELGEHIVVGVDTAAGGVDNVGAQFISKSKIDVPLVFQSKVTMTAFTPQLAEVLEKIYNETQIKPTVAIERANGGTFEIDRLGALNRLGKFEIFRMPVLGNVEAKDAVKLGWDTNTATRPAMLQDLKNGIDLKALILYDKETIDELFSFVVVQTTSTWKAQAENGAHDDLVLSLAIAWQLYQLVPTRRLERVWVQPEYEPADKKIGI